MSIKSRDRYKPFDYNPATVFPFTPAVASPVVNATERADVAGRIKREEQARDRFREYQGFDQTVVFTSSSGAAFNNPAIAGDTRGVLTFIVPQGRVFTVKKIGFRLTDPFLQGSADFSIDIFVDSQRIPFIDDVSGANAGFNNGLGLCFGDIAFPLEIEPLVVNSGSTFSLAITRFDPAFDEFVMVTARVVGKLSKPVGSVD
jgi:hypothetical protein